MSEYISKLAQSVEEVKSESAHAQESLRGIETLFEDGAKFMAQLLIDPSDEAVTLRNFLFEISNDAGDNTRILDVNDKPDWEENEEAHNAFGISIVRERYQETNDSVLEMSRTPRKRIGMYTYLGRGKDSRINNTIIYRPRHITNEEPDQEIDELTKEIQRIIAEEIFRHASSKMSPTGSSLRKLEFARKVAEAMKPEKLTESIDQIITNEKNIALYEKSQSRQKQSSQ